MVSTGFGQRMVSTLGTSNLFLTFSMLVFAFVIPEIAEGVFHGAELGFVDGGDSVGIGGEFEGAVVDGLAGGFDTPGYLQGMALGERVGDERYPGACLIGMTHGECAGTTRYR
jgi:hypothetical protein